MNPPDSFLMYNVRKLAINTWTSSPVLGTQPHQDFSYVSICKEKGKEVPEAITEQSRLSGLQDKVTGKALFKRTSR